MPLYTSIYSTSPGLTDFASCREVNADTDGSSRNSSDFQAVQRSPIRERPAWGNTVLFLTAAAIE